MGILSWIVLGLLAGGLAKFIMPGDDPGGCFITMALGVVGALVGGLLATVLGFGGLGVFGIRSLLIATLGAVILLALYRLVAKKKA